MFPQEAKSLFLVFSNCTDPNRERELNAWYESEYLPLMARQAVVLAAQRYRFVYQRHGRVSYIKAQYVNVYEMDSGDATALHRSVQKVDTAWNGYGSVVEAPLAAAFAPLGREHRTKPTADGNPMLVVVSNCADAARLDEFHRWYDTVHVPHMLGVSGVVSAQRYQRIYQRQGRSEYMAVYDIDVADYVALDQRLKDMVARERAQGQRPVPELNDAIISNIYAPVGRRHVP